MVMKLYVTRHTYLYASAAAYALIRIDLYLMPFHFLTPFVPIS